MLYFYLKTIHVIVGATLFGVALSTSGLLVFAKHNQAITDLTPAVNRWLRMNGFLVLPLLLIQMVLGLSVISIQHYSLTMPWVVVTFVGFILMLFSWLAATFNLLQYKHQSDPILYIRWRRFCLAALIILMVMVFMMANRIA